MTTGLTSTPTYFRGQSLRFRTTFFDFDGNVTQPASANLLVFYTSITQDDIQQTIAMNPGGPGGSWTAILDTRNFSPGKVQWSIDTPLATTAAVEDGLFMLVANQANQAAF